MQVLARRLIFKNKVRDVLVLIAWLHPRRTTKYRNKEGAAKLDKRKLLFLTPVNLSSFHLKVQFKLLPSKLPDQKVPSRKLKPMGNKAKYRTRTLLVTKHSTLTTTRQSLIHRRHLKCSDKLSTPTIWYRFAPKNFKSTKPIRRLFLLEHKAT